MKDFKIKQKEAVSDESLLKHKDFQEVLNKHESISKSYASVRRIWGSIGLAGILITVSIWGINQNSNETVVTKNRNNQPDSIQTTSIEKNIPVVAEIAKPKTIQVVPATIPANESAKKVQEVRPKTESIAINEIATEDSVVTSKVKRSKTDILNDYFQLETKTEEERIKLPVLYIGGQAWPTFVKKSDMVKKGTPTAFYNGVNREIPIVSYSATRVSEDDLNAFYSSNTPLPGKKIINRDGKGTAAVMREIHRMNNNDFIVYQNIIAFIPGVGRVNLGDIKIEVLEDHLYHKRLQERRSILD